MDIFFQDPSAIPLPPAEVRIVSLQAEPYPDGRRVRVEIELTPFQQNPNLDLVIRDSASETCAEANIIETMTPILQLTLHLRHADPQPPFTLSASLFYTAPLSPDQPAPPGRMTIHEAEVMFELLQL